MILMSQVEVDNTRAKLALLESSYENLRQEIGGDEELRTITMQSLKKLINQFTEEIVRYEVGIRSSTR
ncbi:MAG: hypothetical protein SH868_19310 [Bythopirellula sp.]|nr:hypothetical protein [Bythopirellula sp.]